MTPEAIKNLAQQLSKIPSLGPRQATRVAFYLAGLSTAEVNDLAEAISAVSAIKRCAECFSLQSDSTSLCDICADAKRDQALLAIVEKETDLQTIEKTKAFKGKYLVLGQLPKDGILNSEQKMRLEKIKRSGSFNEIIIALSPTTYGDLNASLIAHELKGNCSKITRLGRGIPTGGSIEFADEETLQGALKSRS
jgi:recombination protein RecR